jgi:hypothetical protein
VDSWGLGSRGGRRRRGGRGSGSAARAAAAAGDEEDKEQRRQQRRAPEQTARREQGAWRFGTHYHAAERTPPRRRQQPHASRSRKAASASGLRRPVAGAAGRSLARLLRIGPRAGHGLGTGRRRRCPRSATALTEIIAKLRESEALVAQAGRFSPVTVQVSVTGYGDVSSRRNCADCRTSPPSAAAMPTRRGRQLGRSFRQSAVAQQWLSDRGGSRRPRPG